MNTYSSYTKAPCEVCGRRSIACARRHLGCQTVYCIKHGQHYTGWLNLCSGHDPYCIYQLGYLWNALRTTFRRWCRISLKNTSIQARYDVI